MSRDRLIVALTGASGAPYALNLLRHLGRLGIGVDVLASPSAATVLKQEVDPSRAWVEGGKAVLSDFGLEAPGARAFGHQDFMAPCASGTALRRGMVVIPCSMGTLGRVASGISASLIERAADVCLKERRRLVLVVRESPYSLVHIRNMQSVTEAGAIVLPASPGFYHRPKTLDELMDHLSAKILDVLGIEHDVIRRWGGES